jgi:glycogen operon protein
MSRHPDLEAGQPYPLGATWDGLGVNFAVFSSNASAIELCLFDSTARHETARAFLPQCTDEVWHGYLPGASPGLIYGFRAHGAYEPEAGHRFNSNKLLLDPYAKALAGKLRWSDTLFGYRMHSPNADLSFDRRNSASAMIKAAVVTDDFAWRDDERPAIPLADTVIYEAHVKGITKLLSELGEEERGTYAGLGNAAVIDHLRRLGVTTIELLPVHAILQDRMLVDNGLRNYWGYNTLSYFAVEESYATGNAATELRTAIRRLHSAGLEVILDVVYNHTCEGGELGPTLSWRGFDNASYYRLVDDNRRCSVNDTGTGNTLNFAHPRVIQMTMDSLRYFAESFRVDGFRFDLGATLGREPYGFDPGSGFFDALRQDPVLQSVKIISEPWDIGPGGYQLGKHPPGFSEWNDRYRDTIRRYWRGDAEQRPEIARRLSGSDDIFGTKRRPTASINYIASHDGATLADLTMYEGKHNEANGEDNRDGASDNLSRNWGVEGPTSEADVTCIRDRVARSMLTTLFVSLGTPMLLAGDEFGRTQQGNNNAYCQDNEISWVDWSEAQSDRGRALTDFTSRLISLRRERPLLRAPSFLYGNEIVEGIRDLDWLDERGVVMTEGDWPNADARALVMRRAARREDGKIDVVAVLFNASDVTLDFALTDGWKWELLVDSACPSRLSGPLEEATYRLPDRSCAILTTTLSSP